MRKLVVFPISRYSPGYIFGYQSHYHTLPYPKSETPRLDVFIVLLEKIHCERKLLLKPETLNIEISGPRCALLIYVVTT